ncbi:MAG TPA: apolipoprotein N-acyltransferase, partial [Albitalea sp.]
QGAPAPDAAFSAPVAVLPPAARVAAGALRAFARASLLWMVAAVLFGEGALQANTLAQIRSFVALFLAPEAAAWCVLLAFAARASIDGGSLVLTRGTRRLELALQDIAAVEAWRVPVPGPGAALRLTSGERWHHGLALADPASLARALAAAVGAPLQASSASRATLYSQARLAMRRGRLDQLLAKFVLLPLALAIPAFRLHQHIAYGHAFGEFYTHGLAAYLNAFALWWAAWVIAVVLFAAALRVAVEVGTMAAVLLRPEHAVEARRWLERFALATLYLGLPAWLMLRLVAG